MTEIEKQEKIDALQEQNLKLTNVNDLLEAKLEKQRYFGPLNLLTATKEELVAQLHQKCKEIKNLEEQLKETENKIETSIARNLDTGFSYREYEARIKNLCHENTALQKLYKGLVNQLCPGLIPEEENMEDDDDDV